jgi:hypothetical protein
MYNTKMQGLQRGLTIGLSFLGGLLILGGFVSLIIEEKISSTKSTPFKLIPDILKKMKLEKGEVLADLGSGDGSFLIEANRAKKVKTVGFEISPVHIILSKFKKFFLFVFKGEKISLDLYPENFLTYNKKTFFDFDVIYLNQPESILKYFEPRAKELTEKGIRIFTLQNQFEKLKPIQVHELDKNIKLYEY